MRLIWPYYVPSEKRPAKSPSVSLRQLVTSAFPNLLLSSTITNVGRANNDHTYGVVLAGGGARGAYEAGVFHYIRTALPVKVRTRPFHVYSGSSVGGINVCYLASQADNPEGQGSGLRKTWAGLRQENIYRRDMSAIGKLLINSLAGISVNLLRRPKQVTRTAGIHFRGLVDTSPFCRFLQRSISWQQLRRNVEKKIVHGVSLTLTNMRTGRLEFYVHKHPDTYYHGNYPVRFMPLEWRHAMAGAAIPVFFPPVKIDKTYYADGGLRLNTPMSPAIHMGADRILVVGMHDPSEASDAPLDENIVHQSPPTLGEILGKILNSIFLDRLDYDLKQMDRINSIIRWAEKLYGDDFLEKINEMLARDGIEGDIASRGLKQLVVLPISPSKNVRTIFEDVLNGPDGFGYLSAFEKMLLRLLDVDMHRGEEFLSYLLFLPKYLQRLAELGYEDARAKHDELTAFLE